MSKLSIKAYTTDYKSRWDRFVASLNGIYKGSKNTSFLFHRDFMEYHQDRFEDHSLLIFKDEKVVAVLPANKVGDTVYSHQGLTYGGLVLEAEIRLKEVLEIFEAVLNFLWQSGINILEIKVLPQFYQELPGDEIDYLLFLTKATLVKAETASVIDYRNRIPLNSSRKSTFNQAQKAGLQIQKTKDFEPFWKQILEPNLEARHHAEPTHSLEEITFLAERFKYNIHQFNVLDKKGKICAGATIFETRPVAHVQYISASPQGRKQGALDLLFRYLIEEKYVDKWYFDFGTSNEQAGLKLNNGLQFWKETFGARTRVQRTYRVSTENAHYLKDVVL
ncbi:GNAT family N-acetyltransferase [Leeuwenhoekiella marinoflava]|uniref:Acetyltransferase (GNAT) family protein n=2 Tax=Leeuwenhoekiella marinoflava TaxID=988 RepID=A0A4Q0PLM8_9FLAO|nr:GNAT family N-acetyltransferase [Leeuwenhoekiella marinoflava]RXG29955.1 acetyltransferase (GNAT) family protein [Leeuwenhoekiella marinoflava]SHF25271.1 Acetyltransferase (GNAT) domain-containing protein [Leeuwenhoekiella marinoflava DSM 3653]